MKIHAKSSWIVIITANSPVCTDNLAWIRRSCLFAFVLKLFANAFFTKLLFNYSTLQRLFCFISSTRKFFQTNETEKKRFLFLTEMFVADFLTNWDSFKLDDEINSDPSRSFLRTFSCKEINKRPLIFVYVQNRSSIPPCLKLHTRNFDKWLSFGHVHAGNKLLHRILFPSQRAIFVTSRMNHVGEREINEKKLNNYPS